MIWIIVILCVLAVYWQVRAVRFLARNRNLVIKVTGEKWYAFAASEIHDKRGHHFLKQNFPRLFFPVQNFFHDSVAGHGLRLGLVSQDHAVAQDVGLKVKR